MWNDWHLQRAAGVVAAGGVIAYPTEAVYGLGCDPLNRAAVLRIVALKRRDVGKGFILIAADAGQIEPFVAYPSEQLRAKVLAGWPGPYTWVLPAAAGVPAWLCGRQGGIAVRVTAHPVASALCRRSGPLVSTSANPSGRPAARDALQVRRYFAAGVDYLVPGTVGGAGRPSEIRDARTDRLLRAGERR